MQKIKKIHLLRYDGVTFCRREVYPFTTTKNNPRGQVDWTRDLDLVTCECCLHKVDHIEKLLRTSRVVKVDGMMYESA